MGRECRASGALAAAGLMMAAGASAGGGATGNPDRPVGSGEAGEAVSAGIAEGVAGRLVAPSGGPVAGARITARSLDRPAGPVPEIAILSDADGRFVWPLRPGRYRLAALVGGREVAAATATVEPGRIATLELSAAPPAR